MRRRVSAVLGVAFLGVASALSSAQSAKGVHLPSRPRSSAGFDMEWWNATYGVRLNAAWNLGARSVDFVVENYEVAEPYRSEAFVGHKDLGQAVVVVNGRAFEMSMESPTRFVVSIPFRMFRSSSEGGTDVWCGVWESGKVGSDREQAFKSWSVEGFSLGR